MSSHWGKTLHLQSVFKSIFPVIPVVNTLRAHTGEKIYICLKCIKSLSRSDTFKRHVNSVVCWVQDAPMMHIVFNPNICSYVHFVYISLLSMNSYKKIAILGISIRKIYVSGLSAVIYHFIVQLSNDFKLHRIVDSIIK